MNSQRPTLGCREDPEQIAKYERWAKFLKDLITGAFTLIVLMAFIFIITQIMVRVVK